MLTPKAEKFAEINSATRIVQAEWNSLGPPDKLTFLFEDKQQISLSDVDLKSIREAGVKQRWLAPNNGTFEH